MNNRGALKRLRTTAIALGVFLALGGAAHARLVRTAVVARPFRPVARAAVATAAVVGTAAVIGSVVNSIPPSCQTTVVGNVAYHDCGGTWYQPRYAGSQVTYVVVNPPQ
ncbi:MAG: hypothetical protein ACJ8F1_17735 [Polyangia bacterium]|jgi:hypothetical protein